MYLLASFTSKCARMRLSSWGNGDILPSIWWTWAPPWVVGNNWKRLRLKLSSFLFHRIKQKNFSGRNQINFQPRVNVPINRLEVTSKWTDSSWRKHLQQRSMFDGGPLDNFNVWAARSLSKNIPQHLPGCHLQLEALLCLYLAFKTLLLVGQCTLLHRYTQ